MKPGQLTWCIIGILSLKLIIIETHSFSNIFFLMQRPCSLEAAADGAAAAT